MERLHIYQKVQISLFLLGEFDGQVVAVSLREKQRATAKNGDGKQADQSAAFPHGADREVGELCSVAHGMLRDGCNGRPVAVRGLRNLLDCSYSFVG